MLVASKTLEFEVLGIEDCVVVWVREGARAYMPTLFESKTSRIVEAR